MILIHVQYHLNSSGKTYFPDWVKEVAVALKNHDGFMSVSILKMDADPEPCHILMRFENEEYFQRWADSSDWKEADEKIESYLSEAPGMSIFKETKTYQK